MTEWRFERFRTAYLEMAQHARYRPAAPSDGIGGILLSEEELRDPARLEREAEQYAREFMTEDNAMKHHTGCPDGRGNRAFVYTIEAARALCGEKPELAIDLMKMAQNEITAEYGPKG